MHGSLVGPPPSGSGRLRFCRQDDRYAQSKLVGEPLANWIRAWDSGKLRRAIRLFELTTAQGWTGCPNYGDHCIRVSLARVAAWRCECVMSRAGVYRRFNAENHVFLLIRQRRVNHSVVEQAPDDGKLKQRPSSVPTSSCSTRIDAASKRGAMAKKSMPASHYSMAMDQLHRRSTTANQAHSVPTQGQHKVPDGTKQALASYPALTRQARTAAGCVNTRLELPSYSASAVEKS
jgi:hypothetical protein